ncbi:hypothetical protein XU18_1030 [Perkinsela sp. CCAP 1560/4]|nr:hypothetical protein XU18_1030 [Perkinsela sp. CCAP 1560/4]|eukprot:KNH08461.1 hypothetical protein XU18_1030 [Perkinsela sp. CCAP 1560/4]
MSRRVQKKLVPPVRSEAAKPSREASVKKQMADLQAQLQRMSLVPPEERESGSYLVKVRKSRIPMGRGVCSEETLLALESSTGSVLSLSGRSTESTLVQIYVAEKIPFGLIEISTESTVSASEIVRATTYEGYLPRLHRLFFRSLGTFDSEDGELAQMCQAKQNLIGKLIVKKVISPCEKFEILLGSQEEFGIVSDSTQIMVHRLKERQTDGFSTPWIAQLNNYLDSFFEKSAKVALGNCFLVAGESGTGKSSFMSAFRGVSSYATTVLRNLTETEHILRFDRNSPLVVIFEDVDLWIAVREFPFLERNHLLRRLLERWRERQVVLVMTTSDENQIADFLKSPAYVSEQMNLPMPKRSLDRAKILRSILSHEDTNETDSLIEQVANRTRGYSPRDLCTLTRLAAARAFADNFPVSMAEFEICLKEFRPASMGSHGCSTEIPVVRWDDIGGQVEAKKCLKDCVKWLTTHSSVLKRFHVRAPRGILLHGPPGCSKTMLAKALANECHMQFIPIKGPELLSKWVGDSEKAIRNVFERARAVAPAVLFFDEFDALCGHRSGWSAGNRVISQMLHELDGFHGGESEEDEILVVAATNRPDMIDPALLRPGRFDHKIHISLPRREDIAEILRISLRNIEPAIHEETIAKLAADMDGFSGADCVAVCSEASMIALQADMNAQTLTESHLFDALKKFKLQRRRSWSSHV